MLEIFELRKLVWVPLGISVEVLRIKLGWFEGKPEEPKLGICVGILLEISVVRILGTEDEDILGTSEGKFDGSKDWCFLSLK